MTQCTHCNSNNTKKNGSGKWGQRYYCKDCKRTFSLNKPRFSKKVKFMAIQFYLNNVGIRKIALFLKTSPVSVLRWIRNAHKILQKELEEYNPIKTEQPDIIELDEIYTYVKKRSNEQSYGLLILGGESVLLHIPSEKELKAQ